MSLQSLAKTLQDQGRGNDSVLVHMTPNEVHGLQSLALAHGGSLTINPTTGLAEAGFLEDLLPSVVGIGAGLMGLGPLGIGLASGLTSYATTRDPSRALLSGALSGGLSGLMGGIEEAGTSALGDTSTATGLGKDLITQRSAITPETFGSMPSDLPETASYISQGGSRQYLDPVTGQWTTSNMAANTPNIGAADALNIPGYYNTNAPSYGDKISAGLKSVANNPIDFIKEHPYATAAAGLGLAGMMAPGQATIPGAQAKTGYAPTYGYNPPKQIVDPVTGKVTMVSPSYTQGTPFPYTYYAANGGQVPYPAGGINYPQAHMQDKTDFYAQSTATPTPTAVVGAAPQTDYDARINPQGDVMRAAGGGSVSRKRYVGEDTGEGPYGMPSTELDAIKKIIDASNKAAQSNYAQGGIASLGEYAAGGKLLQGPGDGMSDSIPAVIKGAKPQRAALAQGEFVVPADVVSHLGNGATDAGAKRLYAMMDRVRQARTGTKKQGRQINPEKFMPA